MKPGSQRKAGLLRLMPAIILAAAAFLPAIWFCTCGMFDLFSRGAFSSEDVRLCDIQVSLPHLTPWASVGGCGAGGSGGSSNDGIKWMGNGVSGGLIDLEILPRYSFGEDYFFFTVAPYFSFKPTYTTDLGISIPFMSKTAEVQYLSNQESYNRTTGGLGDIALDFSKKIGMSGEHSVGIQMTLPTGQYDIKRGSDRAQYFLPKELQKGSGLYNAALEWSMEKDVEDGLWKVTARYDFPFNAKPFTRENQMLDKYFEDYSDRTSSRRFYYRFKPYGENDLGAFTPSLMAFSFQYGYRGIEGYTHSWGVNFSAPIGVAWISSEVPGVYDPRPDPEHKAWGAALVYGVEVANPKYPLFIAISTPLNDRTNKPGEDAYDPSPFARWDFPDWSSFLQQWTIAIGVKATMF
ncbi:MAG: hypothetical protein GX556_03910 [Fibrobacter sp.]|nr:hypothetical protein [Fibrobacter sp.]